MGNRRFPYENSTSIINVIQSRVVKWIALYVRAAFPLKGLIKDRESGRRGVGKKRGDQRERGEGGTRCQNVGAACEQTFSFAYLCRVSICGSEACSQKRNARGTRNAAKGKKPGPGG